MKAQLWLLLPLIVLLGCDDGCGGTGPPVAALVESGAYTAQDPYAGPLGTPELLNFPHAGGRDFMLSVDREDGRVTVRYERDGQIVEEIWRITAQEVSSHL